MIYSIGDRVDYSKLYWSSDWCGEELGYEDISVVGLYLDPTEEEVYYYIDIEKGRVLEIIDFKEEEEE